jgi:hypothetical protein
MTKIEEKIEEIIALLKDEDFDEANFELKHSDLGVRLHLAKEAILLDELYEDSSKKVRLEVAKHAHQLYSLRSDKSWEVKLEVYKQTNFEYMNFDNIYKENIEIQKEAFAKGDMPINSEIFSNIELSKIAVKFLNKSELEKLFNNTKFKDIEELCIKNGMDCSSEYMNNLLKDWKFRLWCIENERNIGKIFIHYKTSTKTLLELLRNGYKDHEHNGDSVLELAMKKNSNAIIDWMIDNHEHLNVVGIIHDVQHTIKLIDATSNKEVLTYIVNNKPTELSNLAANKLNSIDGENNVIPIDLKFKNVKKF